MSLKAMLSGDCLLYRIIDYTCLLSQVGLFKYYDYFIPTLLVFPPFCVCWWILDCS